MSWKQYDHDIPPGHPFVETRDMHPTDILLRQHGYRIAARPRNEEPTWSLAGVEYTQSQALAQVSEKG